MRKGLEKFSAESHDIHSWRKHIETDLGILKSIHERIVQARSVSDDEKLKAVVARARKQRDKGRKIL